MKYYTTPILLFALNFFFACVSPDQSDQAQSVLLKAGTNMAIDLSPDKTTLVIDLQGTLWSLGIDGGTATAITDNLGGCHSPHWAPDGKTIAFHSYRDGNFHIWTCKPDGSALTQVTFGKFDDREPYWAPDGQSIYFSSDRGGSYDIWQYHLNDQKLQQLTDLKGNEYYPLISPNSKVLIHTTDNEGISFEGKGEVEVNGTLRIDETILGQASYHPSGDFVLVQSRKGVETYFLKFPTKKLKDFGKIEPNIKDIFPFRPSWLDDSTFITTGDGKIFKVNLSGKSEEIPFEAEVLLERKPYQRKNYDFDDDSQRMVKGLRNPSLSPDGQSVVVTAKGDLWIQHIDGSTEQLTDDHFVDIDPMFSHNGNSIAFASDRGGNMDIWVMDLTDKSLRQVSQADGDSMYPCWGPKDNKLSYLVNSRLNAWGAASIHVVDLVSGLHENVHDPIFVPGQAAWTPDGQHLWFVALKPNSTRFREGKNYIRQIDLQTKETDFLDVLGENILSTRGKNGPIWSPDGKYIAMILNGSLWVQEMKGLSPIGEATKLMDGLSDMPSWSGNSQELFVVQMDAWLKVSLDGGIKPFPNKLTWEPKFVDSKIIIQAGKVFNGKMETYLTNKDIWIEKNRIIAIRDHQENPPKDFHIIDAKHQVLMPGLFDMHVHQYEVSGESVGRTWLAYGITSLREVGANPYDVIARKEAWESGRRPGPRQFYTGGLTAGNRIYYGLANSIADSNQLDLELERAIKLDYDLIKTYVRMPDPWQKRVVSFAHEHGLPVSSHELYPAVAYGTDAIEHFLGTSRRGYSLKQTALMRVYDDVKTLLASSGMSITPTLALGGGITPYLAQHPEILEDPIYHSNYTLAERESFEGFVFRQMKNQLADQTYKFEQQQDFLLGLHQAGGTITAGTDSPFLPYGWSIHAEMEIYVDAGLTPFDVLRSATSQAAVSTGVGKDLGSIEMGKLADLVIVEGDPLSRIEDARKVVLTLKNGIMYKKAQLLGR